MENSGVQFQGDEDSIVNPQDFMNEIKEDIR